jgi:hypothetical protein
MTDFILNYSSEIGALLVSLAMVIWAVYTRSWAVLQVAAYKLMLSAEKLMATEEGTEKMEEVYAAVWSKIPKWVKKFVTEKTLREKLQDWYNIARNSLGGDHDESQTSTNT